MNNAIGRGMNSYAYEEGKVAHADCLGPSDNPYEDENDVRHTQWAAGWTYAEDNYEDVNE